MIKFWELDHGSCTSTRPPPPVAPPNSNKTQIIAYLNSLFYQDSISCNTLKDSSDLIWKVIQKPSQTTTVASAAPPHKPHSQPDSNSIKNSDTDIIMTCEDTETKTNGKKSSKTISTSNSPQQDCIDLVSFPEGPSPAQILRMQQDSKIVDDRNQQHPSQLASIFAKKVRIKIEKGHNNTAFVNTNPYATGPYSNHNHNMHSMQVNYHQHHNNPFGIAPAIPQHSIPSTNGADYTITPRNPQEHSILMEPNILAFFKN